MTFLLAQLMMMLLQHMISQYYMFGWVNFRKDGKYIYIYIFFFCGCLIEGMGEKKIGEILVFSRLPKCLLSKIKRKLGGKRKDLMGRKYRCAKCTSFFFSLWFVSLFYTICLILFLIFFGFCLFLCFSLGFFSFFFFFLVSSLYYVCQFFSFCIIYSFHHL